MYVPDCVVQDFVRGVGELKFHFQLKLSLSTETFERWRPVDEQEMVLINIYWLGMREK